MKKSLQIFLRSSKKQYLNSLKTKQYSTKRAIIYEEFGNPKKHLKSEEISVKGFNDNQIEVKMLASAINPADINMVQGTYGNLPNLPAVGGNEGVGVVTKIGSNAKTNLKENDRVIVAKPGLGTWSTSVVGEASDFLKVSEKIPVEYAATLNVNPCTAYRLLHDFASLKPGDVIIQNASNSMVGQSVIQIAKDMGVKTINIIRARKDEAEMIERLKNVGGDIVVTEGYAITPNMQRLISDLPKPKLALNAVGGDSARTLLKTLDNNGVLVTYGGMSRKPVSISTSQLIFQNLSVKGFWLTEWVKQNPVEKRIEMLNYLSGLVEQKKLVLFMEVFKLSNFDAALDFYNTPQRERKVILDNTK